MPRDAAPLDIIRASTDLLYAVLQDAYDCAQSAPLALRESFIYRHARNISDLSEDCLHLAIAERWCGPMILTRCITEGLFCMAAAVELPEFAAEKVIAETEHYVRKVSAWKDVEEAESLNETISELQQFVLKLRGEHVVTTNRKWSVAEVARVAKLEDDYARSYFVYCQHTHATVSGVIAQENRSGVGLMLQILAMAVIRATYYLVRGVPTSQGQAHIDRATELLGSCTALAEAAKFTTFRPAKWPPFDV